MFSKRPQNEFQRQWNRNWLTVFLPGFAVFGFGALIKTNAVVIGGWLVILVATLRALRLVWKYRRCSSCRFVNSPRLNANEFCLYCGAELPLDGLPE